jgi:hypothetical protein
MNAFDPAPAPQDFEPFSYRGWNFLCAAVDDGNGLFWSIVICEMTWTSGLPFVIAHATPSHSRGRALVRARSRAAQWVRARTVGGGRKSLIAASRPSSG